MTYTYPKRPTQKIKGNFVDVLGRKITFEIPGIFNEDKSCDKPACDAAVADSISSFNATAIINTPE
jgi:hypothetical protein